jgi:YD repeat-containing protein
LARAVQPGSSQTTTYGYDTEGRVVQELAPLPPGVSSCTTWQAGCKALQLAYNASGHLTAVTFRTTTAAGVELKGPGMSPIARAERCSRCWDTCVTVT